MRLFAIVATASLLAAPLHAQSTLTGDLPRKDDRPLEAEQGIETEYGQVTTSEGLRLRSLVSRPTGTGERLPALFLTQWVSCGTVEFTDGPSRLAELVRRSGWALIRVERSGDGDSEGPGCDALDYDTEVRHYREAFDQLSEHRWIDPDKIVIYGSSLGSTTAPLVAQGKSIAGIMVQGGGAETYLERMIDFDRLYLERSGRYAPDQIHEEMLKRIPFLFDYLIRDREPEDIEASNPELAGVWESIRGTGGKLHYGRPRDWHRQAAKRDFAEAWSKIDVPVLVLWGEYEQFERRYGHELIAQIVNANHPGKATFVVVPKADHGLHRYPDAISAYRGEGREQDWELFLHPVTTWLTRISG